MSYRLGWYTTCSPLRGSCVPYWRHHDPIMNWLVKNKHVQIVVPNELPGGKKFMSRLYSNKDESVLYSSLRGLGVDWRSKGNPMLDASELDGLYIDTLYSFHDKEVEEQVRGLIRDAIKRKIPILLSDTDGFTVDDIEGTRAAMRDVYEEDLRDYENLTVIGPLMIGGPAGYKFMPFEVDPQMMSKIIVPAPDRSYLLHYIGHEYYRAFILPYLDKIAQSGRVRLSGSGWTKYEEEYFRIEFSQKLAMNPESSIKYYSDSILAYCGTSQYCLDRGRSITLLRWKEALVGGTFILHDQTLEEGLALFDLDLELSMQLYLDNQNTILPEILLNYESTVTRQRESLLKLFNVSRWAPIFSSYLGIK